ncbi:MAG: UvrD-helicase domain-containing protein [Chlorobiaceae bacterium]|nr:UvrD-helicase domain-containing protein [Chlorobiaceae bacterium]NTW74142.1 UvrD-helicase domain-containing protein [Chlorobiaceae bacterium]
MTDFLRELNDVQREAVLATEGPVMVLAGAGSGKTRVITYRIAHLIRNVDVPPQNILALTFTNKAAKEMRHRIDGILERGSSSSLWIGTFHSVFARLLRSYIHLIGYDRNFSIFDADDSKSLVKQCMQELNLSPDSLPVNLVHALISKAKNSFVLPPEFHRNAGDYQQQKAALVYEKYAQKLRENNALDFDDLLIKPIELFGEQPGLLDQLQDYFRYLLIDEYQDTNRAQYLVAKMLSEKHRNIFVVGDDAQSIYSWRGADISNMLNFQDDYQDSKLFKLVDNYRSTETILQAANDVIRNNRRQIKKELVAKAGPGDPLTLIEAYNERREAERVAEYIRSIHLSKGCGYRAFAIFYRTNAQSRVIEDVMRQNRIPYRIFGSVSFYKRKEIKDAVAYLRLVLNDRDGESLLRVINFPPRKIGEVSISKLKEFAEAGGMSLYEAIRRADEGGFQSRLAHALKEFATLVETLKQKAVDGTAYDVLSLLFEMSSIPSLLQAENTVEALARHENLQELLSMARDFSDHNPNNASLGDFLSTISLASDIEDVDESENYVSIMTVHAAKGLEFPVVFVTGMEERLFPLNSYEPAELEEERRLFYVAITRAREKLFLSWAQSRYMYGQPQMCLRSTFINEIDPDIICTEGGRPLSESPKKVAASAMAGRPVFGTLPSASRPAVPVQRPDAAQPASPARKGALRAGTKVQHAIFGPGTVIEVQGSGSKQKVKIGFRTAGEKTLMVQYANLKIV